VADHGCAQRQRRGSQYRTTGHHKAGLVSLSHTGDADGYSADAYWNDPEPENCCRACTIERKVVAALSFGAVKLSANFTVKVPI